MQVYYFILSDELGEEFDVTVRAPSFDMALAKVESEYPESCVEHWSLSAIHHDITTYIVKG